MALPPVPRYGRTVTPARTEPLACRVTSIALSMASIVILSIFLSQISTPATSAQTTSHQDQQPGDSLTSKHGDSYLSCNGVRQTISFLKMHCEGYRWRWNSCFFDLHRLLLICFYYDHSKIWLWFRYRIRLLRRRHPTVSYLLCHFKGIIHEARSSSS